MRKLLRSRPRILAVAAAFATPLAATALGESAAKSGGGKSVSVRDDVFSPRSTSVATGGKVTWRWRGDNPHNVVFRKVPSGASKRGASTRTRGRFSRTFKKAGRYRYVCTIHEDAGMRGSVSAG